MKIEKIKEMQKTSGFSDFLYQTAEKKKPKKEEPACEFKEMFDFYMGREEMER